MIQMMFTAIAIIVVFFAGVICEWSRKGGTYDLQHELKRVKA